MDKGELVPDELVIAMILEKVEERGRRRLPARRLPAHASAQADALAEELEKLGRRLTAALLIDAPDDEVIRRLSGRRVCSDGPRLPRRQRPAQARGRLRPGRQAAAPAQRRRARRHPEAPRRPTTSTTEPLIGVLRRARPAAPLRRHAAPGRGARPHPRDARDAAPGRAAVIIKKTPAEIDADGGRGRHPRAHA